MKRNALLDKVEIDLVWIPNFEMWSLTLRIPNINYPVPTTEFWIAGEKPTEAMKLTYATVMQGGYRIGVKPDDLYQRGYMAFGLYLLDEKNPIFGDHPGLSNAEIAEKVHEHCSTQYLKQKQFWHHCQYPYTPQNAAPMFNGIVTHGSHLKNIIPGLNVVVNHPARPATNWTVDRTIQDLNDKCRWTREQVADWLDTLDVDLSFPVEVESGT